MKEKLIFLILVFCNVFFSELSAQSPPEILHYNFNGTSTLIPNLASSPPVGTANATIVGTQTLGAGGQCGNALVGDGSTSSYVNTGWTTSLSGSWSISFWTASITPSSTLWYIFGDANASSFRCFTNGVAGANNWMLRGPITDILLTGGATMAPQLNTFVYNSTTGVLSSYLNAVFNASVSQSPVSISGTGPFKVGQYATNNGLPSGGLMDEFRFYSRALTVPEIQSLLNVTPTSTNITATSCGPYVSAGNNTYTATGNYTETFNSCGGMVTNTLNLTINPVPTLTASASNTLLCDGQTTSLTAIGSATSYSWSFGSTASATFVAPSTSTNYIVTASLGSCTRNDTINITVNPTPLVTLAASISSLCIGNSVTLTASGAPVYSWSPVTSSGTVLVDSPTNTTTYSVTGTNTFGCSDTKTVSVEVYSFTPGITSPTTICSGEGINIVSTGGTSTSYTWSTGFNGFDNINVTPSVTTGYTVTTIGVNGCTGSNSTTITVSPNPTVTASAQRTVMCKGETNTLTASGATSYSWSNGSTSTGSVVIISPPNNITYNYSVTGTNADGCADGVEVAVKVLACTGLPENQALQNQVNVFPNPGNGIYTVQLNSVEDSFIEIRNTLGSLLLTQHVTKPETKIELQDQPNGIYFIQVQQNGKITYTSRIIKK